MRGSGRQRGAWALLVCGSFGAASWFACVGDPPTSGGAGDDASTGALEGGALADAGADAEADGGVESPCVVDGTNFEFCDNFDGVPQGEPFSPKWEVKIESDGRLERDSTVSRSTPHSFKSRLDPLPPGGVDNASASLSKTFSSAARRAFIRFDFRPGAFKLEGGDPNRTYPVFVESIHWVAADDVYAVTLVAKANVTDGGTPTLTTSLVVANSTSVLEQSGPLVGSPAFGSWAEVEIEIDLDAPKIEIKYDGNLAGTLTPNTTPGAVSKSQVTIGLQADNSIWGNGAWTANFDNVAVRFP